MPSAKIAKPPAEKPSPKRSRTQRNPPPATSSATKPARNLHHSQAHIVAALGSTGTGKTYWIRQQIAGEPRLMVWDALDEYAEIPAAAGMSDLLQQLAAAKSGPLRIRYLPGQRGGKDLDQSFAIFCRLAAAWQRCAVLVEELRFVTTPSRAPVAWASLTLRGRHWGLRIFGTSQRPAHIDKDFLGQCTVIRTGALSYPEDVSTVARIMRVQPEQIDALRDHQALIFERKTRSVRSD